MSETSKQNSASKQTAQTPLSVVNTAVLWLTHNFILVCAQKDDNDKKVRSNQMTHELASNTLQHQQATEELLKEEKKLETLLAKLAVKRDHHEERITGIKKIIEERSVLLERQDERNKKKVEILTQADMGVDEEQKLKRMNVIRQLYTTILEKKMTHDEDHLSTLEDTFHRLKNVTGLTNVSEVVDKFMSRNEKNLQLAEVAEDLNFKIEQLKEENKASKVILDELINRTEANAGNREVYQEVDLIDVAVGSATKQCDDSRGRATRLSVTIGELRETISRFLSKVQVSKRERNELPKTRYTRASCCYTRASCCKERAAQNALPPSSFVHTCVWPCMWARVWAPLTLASLACRCRTSSSRSRR